MKKILVAVGILAVLVAAAIGYKTFSTPGGIASVLDAKAPAGYTFAQAVPRNAPPMDGYKPATVDLGDGPVPLVTLPLDTWGYQAVFAANGGINPSKESLFYQYGHFGVQLVRVEDSEAQLAGYASGQYPIVWSQIDAVPQLVQMFKADKRVRPKVLSLIDWSFGGDGILAKAGIQSAADLKGKVVLTSSNTPYAFFLLWYLAQSDLAGTDVKVIWEGDVDKALKLFQSDPSIAAWVTWSPFLTDCLDAASPSYVKDSRLMISSKDANQLIADVFLVRSDFAQQYPKIAEGFVTALAAAADRLDDRSLKAMETFYGLKSTSEAASFVAGIHIANFPEALMFFDPKNTVGAAKVFRLSQEYSKELGVLAPDTSFDPNDYFLPEVYASIAKTNRFAAQKNAVLNSFNVATKVSFSDLEDKTIVQSVNIQLVFDPNQDTFDINSSREDFQNNMRLLDKVDEQAKFLSTTAIELIGNTDTSMRATARAKGKDAYAIAAADNQELSERRAAFVRQLLIDHYRIPANRVISKGVGWDNPVDPANPENPDDFAKDRRVDVKFVSLN